MLPNIERELQLTNTPTNPHSLWSRSVCESLRSKGSEVMKQQYERVLMQEEQVPFWFPASYLRSEVTVRYIMMAGTEPTHLPNSPKTI